MLSVRFYEPAMRVSLSYDSVPELADLTAEAKRTVFFYYQYQQPSVPGFRFFEVGFVGFIILAEIAGFIGGFVYWRNPFWGPLAGALLALAGVLVVGYALNTYLTIPKFRRFLRSEEAQRLIRVLKAKKDDYEI